MILDVDQNLEKVQKWEKPEMHYPLQYNLYKNKANNLKSNSKKTLKISSKGSYQNGKLAESLEKSSLNIKLNIMH